MPAKKVAQFLDNHKVKYVMVKHSTAFTAQEIAASAHIPGKELAKTVMVKLDGTMAMAVLPASYRVDFKGLKKLTGAKKVELASEDEFQRLFPECEIGAMPPFGNLYDMAVYVANPLPDDDEIAFNAGSHTELIRLHYADFQRLVEPVVADFGQKE
ncbi:YbaK/EbsC family protein [bacterium]|nr:YbaK/EbsC family protein [bacterium]